MKTACSDISQQNFSQELLEKLSDCIQTKNVLTLWYGPIWASPTLRGLWMYTKDKQQVKALFTPSYIKTLLDEEQLVFISLDTVDFNYHASIGNPLFKTSLTANRILYQTTSLPPSFGVNKSMGNFIALYQDKQALLSSYCNDFLEQQFHGSSHAFLKSFTHDLDVLETVLLGVKQTTATLTHRLLVLEQIIPKMKTLFVKRQADVYYILNDLAQNTEDVPYNMWGLSLQKVQKKLNHIVLTVLEQIDGQTTIIQSKRTLKKKKIKPFKYKEKLLPLLSTNQIEEIYQFHEMLFLNQTNPQKHVYLVVLTKETPSKEIKKIIQTIEAQKENIQFTLLAHTRFYIQESVYEFSDFFKTALHPKNKIYASDYYPQIHWYKSQMKDYSDFTSPLKERTERIHQTLRQDLKNSQNHTFITTNQLYTCLSAKFKIYIIHHLHYLPNTNNLNTLLHLALYAENQKTTKLHALYKALVPTVLTYTINKKKEKKNNLILDSLVMQQLQQLLDTIAIDESTE
ncbi:hypothetical protein HX004_07675 [Myroides sp. 1354]|nr:hypothetical protein [Myroides sp. R163-1]MDM1055653.1 hypothetical protein [Myroides sp. 1354]MDM1068950.1 hypothetical protein [Myroides sp. 1372]